MKKLLITAAAVMLTTTAPAFAQQFLPYGCESCRSQAAWFDCDRNEGTFDRQRYDRLQRRLYEANHPPAPDEATLKAAQDGLTSQVINQCITANRIERQPQSSPTYQRDLAIVERCANNRLAEILTLPL